MSSRAKGYSWAAPWLAVGLPVLLSLAIWASISGPFAEHSAHHSTESVPPADIGPGRGSSSTVSSPPSEVSKKDQQSRISGPQAALALQGIASLAALLPTISNVAGLGVSATEGTAVKALGGFTESFSQKLGETLGEKTGDAITSQVAELFKRLTDGHAGDVAPDVQETACAKLRPTLAALYVRVLAVYSVRSADSVAVQAVGHLDEACRSLARALVEVSPQADPTLTQAVLELAVYTAVLDAETPLTSRPTAPATVTVTVTVTATATATATGGTTQTNSPPPPYTVKPGDSLWRIAVNRLPGNSSALAISVEWQKLWAANIVTIGPNPDLIRPGVRLVIPPQ
jgi:LysM repeat protein